ncbi:hypothetical protein EDC94DRAFT_658264 [Helicostylum pulchrum]|nr:hypothetical protein EDC94DRAFT_658264 [Helicostylum pulchrum]
MLLNKENLILLTNEAQQEKVKLDRILLYIRDQKAYCSYYKSPNHSITSSTISAASASVSYKHPTVKTNSSTKFSSPNLEMNRITIKQNRPKLGLFNKGKSSAQATKTVPDLVFSEAKFLKKRKQDSHDTLKKKKKSKFFKQQQKSDTLSPVNSPHRSSHKQINSQVSSNQTIKRILKECQDAPQLILQRNSLDYYYESDERNDQVPTYAPVKTPTKRTVHDPITISESNKPSSHEPSSHNTDVLSATTKKDSDSPADLEDALNLFYKSHDIIPPHQGTSSFVAEDWQIESLSSDPKEEYGNDILNFWEYQYKRTL